MDEPLTKLTIVCVNASDGTVTQGIIRRTDNPMLSAIWFSLNDLLFFLGLKSPSASVKSLVSQLAASQKKEMMREWWLSRDGFVKVSVERILGFGALVLPFSWDLVSNGPCLGFNTYSFLAALVALPFWRRVVLYHSSRQIILVLPFCSLLKVSVLDSIWSFQLWSSMLLYHSRQMLDMERAPTEQTTAYS